jgi:glycosyltransferase involved in cell wall biosynthesis
MQMQKNITATIITLNEEKHIREVIENVQKVCDEVIVVDSFSTDKTAEIARSLGARVIEQKFLGDGKQKAFCEQFSKNDWLLSIDADERLEDEAVQKILDLDLENSHFDAYSFRRKSYIGKKYIKQWYPDRVTRLYNKKKCGYNVDGAHAAVKGENTKDLNVDMLHYSFSDFGQLVEKAYRYAVEFAHIRHNEGKRAAWYDPFLHGFAAMFKGMIIKGGITGGIHEWHVAFASAYNSYMKYVVMLELQEKELNEK